MSQKHDVKWCLKPVNIPGVLLKNYQKETAFQIYCADWLRKRYELTGNELFRWWHHSANERSNSSEGFTAKMMGQASGFPDFVQIGLRLAIELKIGRAQPSQKQIEWLDYLRANGWQVQVVRTFEEFERLVLQAIQNNTSS